MSHWPEVIVFYNTRRYPRNKATGAHFSTCHKLLYHYDFYNHRPFSFSIILVGIRIVPHLLSHCIRWRPHAGECSQQSQQAAEGLKPLELNNFIKAPWWLFGWWFQKVSGFKRFWALFWAVLSTASFPFNWPPGTDRLFRKLSFRRSPIIWRCLSGLVYFKSLWKEGESKPMFFQASYEMFLCFFLHVCPNWWCFFIGVCHVCHNKWCQFFLQLHTPSETCPTTQTSGGLLREEESSSSNSSPTPRKFRSKLVPLAFGLGLIWNWSHVFQ